MPAMDLLFETLAADISYPNKQDIIISSGDRQMSAEWDLFNDYSKQIASYNGCESIPLCSSSGLTAHDDITKASPAAHSLQHYLM